MQGVIILARLNLEKTILKLRKRNYIFYEWSLVTFKELKNCCQEGEGRANRSKQREGQRDKVTIFCSIICEFLIFLCCFLVLCCSICLIQFHMPWEFGFPLRTKQYFFFIKQKKKWMLNKMSFRQQYKFSHNWTPILFKICLDTPHFWEIFQFSANFSI